MQQSHVGSSQSPLDVLRVTGVTCKSICYACSFALLTMSCSMHEAPANGRLPTGLAVAGEVMSEGEEESAADSSVRGELSPSTVATSEAPTCSSVTAEDQKTNFYPVTWRVVGGGVTLGGKRKPYVLVRSFPVY